MLSVVILLPARRESRKRRFRGTRTQGYGRVGQHRKSGGRGGTGRAALDKHKHKSSGRWIIEYEPNPPYKHGFLPMGKPRPIVKTINVGELETLIPSKGQSKGKIELNMAELGYDKILGSGKLKLPLVVKAYSFAAGAKTKIESAGGETVVLGT